MTTGQILTEGTETFTPILTRLLNIAKELIPYVIYIVLGTLGVSLIWTAVKYIMRYLKRTTEGTIQGREDIQKMIEDAGNERDIERDMFQDYEDYRMKHGKYRDGEYPTQEERIQRQIQRKKEHPGYDYF